MVIPRIKKREESLAIISNKRLTDNGRGLALIAKAHPDHDYQTADKTDDGLNHFTIWFPERANINHIFDPENLANQGEIPAIAKGAFLDRNKQDISRQPTLMLIDDDTLHTSMKTNLTARCFYRYESYKFQYLLRRRATGFPAQEGSICTPSSSS